MADQPIQQRLAAVLVADVVGYTRLMEVDTEGTVAAWQTVRDGVINPTVSDHSGRIVKLTGDGFLAEFPTVHEAVKCGIAMQEGFAETSLEFRIGINLGDIIDDGQDIHGEGVNVAARIEALAEPGGICISGAVYDQVRNRIEATYEDKGERKVKNVTAPVRVYTIQLDGAAAAVAAMVDQVVADKPSIAVLPFENMSGDPEQEYFSDGMSEDLITDISNISGLFVIARNSSFAFKGKALDVKDIAEQLGVKHILEGSVRKMGAKLRVNAQLIDAASGGHIWAERYDGDLADIFEFQDNIRKQIVSALQVSLTPTDRKLTERRPTNSEVAYDLFLKGRANIYRFTPEHLPEAIKCLEEAIEIDPNFADAYSYLSYCHIRGWFQMWPGFDDTLERANKLAEKGVALDSTSAIALTRLGWIQTYLHRYDQAVANLENAIALAPNNAEVNAYYGQVLNYWGNPEKGLEMLERALSLDTIVPPNWEFYAGHSHLLLRQYDQALTRFNRMVERAPYFTSTYVCLACAYVELDRLDDAREMLKTALEITPQYTLKEVARIYPYRFDEDRNRILDSLRKAGLSEE